MTGGEASWPEPIFIGGSARSGTHAMGRLVAAHPRYHLIGTEARLHSFQEGLPDLLAGKVELSRFLELCRGHWWKRGYRGSQGLVRVADREQREQALREFERAFPEDPARAGRDLVRALLDPAARTDGKPAWVEVTGWNVQSAPTLLRLFPRARFINMVRDGRAVVAGHLQKKSLTDDPAEALVHWKRRVRAAHAALRSLPAGTAAVIDLEDLAAHRRERTLERVIELLELDDDEPVRSYFQREISASAANVGRWRERMAPPDARQLDRRYRRLVRELRGEGIDWVPAPEARRLTIDRIPSPRRSSLARAVRRVAR